MDEKEYIEREPLKRDLIDRGFYPAIVKAAVEAAPAADVVEVVHGEWIEENDGTHSCSVCGHDATYTYDGTEVLGFACPYCVSIMDGRSRPT